MPDPVSEGNPTGQEQEFLDDNYPPPGGAPPVPPAVPTAPPKEPKPKEAPKEDAYPLPDKSKPMKVNAAELEFVLLAPKGYKGEAPVEQAVMEKVETISAELSQVKALNEELQKAVETQKTTIDELNKKLEGVDAAKRDELATEITELRVEKGLLSKDDAEEEIKKLATLGEELLTKSLEDTKKLTEKVVVPQVKSGNEKDVELSEDDVKMKAKRLELFGHEEPVEEYVKKLEEEGEL